MSPAVEHSLSIVAYLALFGGVGFLFVFVNLLIGRFVRPNNPHPEKLEIYECGEPTIGSSFVQFDLRFYVVALVFIIFDVEVAFLFPWATVFGKATTARDEALPAAVATADGMVALTPEMQGLYREMGVRNPTALGATSEAEVNAAIRGGANQLVWFSLWVMAVFFVVLLIGFAYEWKTGALDWVRAVSQERNAQSERGPPSEAMKEDPLLVA